MYSLANVERLSVYDKIASLPPCRGSKVNRGALALDTSYSYAVRLDRARKVVREVLGRDLTPNTPEIIRYIAPGVK